MLSRRRALAGVFVFISALWFYQHYCQREDVRNRQFEWFHDLQREDSFLNDTLGFEKIFVINLPSRRDRRDAMGSAGELRFVSLSFSHFLRSWAALEFDTSLSKKGNDGAKGSWLSHLSVLERVVNEGLGSALVLEDDIDWDVRLKAQMRVFAAAARLWQSETAERGKLDNLGEEGVRRQDIPLSPAHLRSSHPDNMYGENWDVLWLGHCGAYLPSSPSPSNPIITIPFDPTVPAKKHLKPHPFALHDQLADEYPAHTRVVHAAEGNICSLAYAVSAQGARKLVKRFREEGYRQQWDLMLRDVCMGKEESEEDRGGAESDEDLVCLTIQPPLFSHRYGGDTGSDIRGQGGGFARGKMGSPYIRMSVHGNLERLKNGLKLSGSIDMLPDDGETLW
ncbi:glycosyltransferase family 25 protein [Xylariaceae sp. FL1019]|nr:glycosyltransferase family 25 protein [Xylariaceae sp. FL1019]